MPQPKSSGSSGKRGSGSGRSTRSKSGSSTPRKRTGSSSAKAKRSGPGQAKRSGSAQAKRSGSAQTKRSGGGQSRRSTGASRSGTQSAARQQTAGDDGATAAFVEFLQRSVEGPLNVVMLTNDRIQEVLDDAVERGRMTRDDAEDMAAEILRRGRQQTADLLADFAQLLGRSRDNLESTATGAATAARRSKPADRMLREVDRARRVAGLGSAFPILSYDDLTAAQITERLEDLTPAELRKVRDYERRHGNRKSVLQAIEAKLG